VIISWCEVIIICGKGRIGRIYSSSYNELRNFGYKTY